MGGGTSRQCEQTLVLLPLLESWISIPRAWGGNAAVLMLDGGVLFKKMDVLFIFVPVLNAALGICWLETF